VTKYIRFESISVAVTTLLLACACASAAEQGPRNFYIKTVHIDGKANVSGDASHPPEPFPAGNLPGGGGLKLTKPDQNGDWKMRAFTFQPSQIIVHQDDQVRLNFIGVQGPKHTIHVAGEGVDQRITLSRGTMETVEFIAGKPGIVEIECYDHEPVMNAEVVILPKQH